MDDTAVNDIARFFRRLQWALVALAACWLVWLMGPVLTPFVVAALLGWLGDPLVDRLQRAGRSGHTAVVLVFALMVLLLALEFGRASCWEMVGPTVLISVGAVLLKK